MQKLLLASHHVTPRGRPPVGKAKNAFSIVALRRTCSAAWRQPGWPPLPPACCRGQLLSMSTLRGCGGAFRGSASLLAENGKHMAVAHVLWQRQPRCTVSRVILRPATCASVRSGPLARCAAGLPQTWSARAYNATVCSASTTTRAAVGRT